MQQVQQAEGTLHITFAVTLGVSGEALMDFRAIKAAVGS